jgi:hypothetical protein
MSPRPDDELRSRFAELRDADARHAPAYRAVLERTDRRVPGVDRNGRRRTLRLALAAAAAIVLAVGVARVSRRRAFVAPPLSTWTSPTASLLRTPGAELLASPTLLSSVLDPVTTRPTLRAGTHR